MKDLIRETLQQASREAPAIPLSTLVTRLRARGAAVTEAVLVRALEAPDSGARLVDPWRGPHAPLRLLLPEGGGELGPWVVLAEADGEDPDPDAPVPTSVRRTLLRLGRSLDARSPGDLARWMALVQEARRLPRAA